MDKVSEFSCRVNNLVDTEDGQFLMKSTTTEKYLGMIIDHRASNKQNIEARKSRGLSAINEILSILDENWFGKYFFKVLSTLRNALLINSVLSNASVWYGVKMKEIE